MFFMLVVLWIFNTLTLSMVSSLVFPAQNVSMEDTQLEQASKPTTSVYDDPDVLNSFGVLHTLTKFIEWAVAEEEIVKVFIHRQQMIAAELQLIQQYLDDYEEMAEEILKNLKLCLHDTPEDPSCNRLLVVASRPVSAHRMTRRYSVIFHQLGGLLTCSEFVDNQIKLEGSLKFKNNNWIYSEFVGWDDLYMSMNAFIHFNEVYGFKPVQMTRGLVLDTSAGGQLHALHAAEIGVFSLFRQKQALSIDWLESAKKTIIYDSSDVSVAMDVLTLYLRVSIQRHNRDLKTLQDVSKNNSEDFVTHEYLTFYVHPVTENEAPENREVHWELFYYNLRGFGSEAETEAQFIDLCLGNEPQNSEMQQNLKCFYERKRHPYLTINPIKTEQLSENPPIFQFYEMLGNVTIELMKRENRPHTRLSGVVGAKGVRSVTDYRTSAGTFLTEETPTTKKICSLAEAVTGLRITNASEHIQFVEYTYGRFYTFHKDVLQDGNSTKDDVLVNGDRLATILYYLDVPELGGNTPFCAAGISARPVKGSAVLWYNLYRNGSTRMDVTHGSCPVVHGHKIIMNHWVRYNGNWKTFPCSLNQFD